MNVGIVLFVLFVLLLIGALPTWPYSADNYPFGSIGLLLLIWLILVPTRRSRA